MKKILLFLLPILIFSQEAGLKRDRQGNVLATKSLSINPVYKSLQNLERLPLKDITKVLQQPDKISWLKSKHGVFLSNALKNWLRVGGNIFPFYHKFSVASHVGPEIFVPAGPVRTNSNFSLLLTNTLRHSLTNQNLHFSMGLPESSAGVEQAEYPNLAKNFLFLDHKGNPAQAKMNISNRLCYMIVNGFDPNEQKRLYDLRMLKDSLEKSVFILNKKNNLKLAVKGENDPLTHYLSAVVNPQEKTINFVAEHTFINFEETEEEVADVPFKTSPSGHLMFAQSIEPFLIYRLNIGLRLNREIISANIAEYKPWKALRLTDTFSWYFNNPRVANREEAFDPGSHCSELVLSDYISNIGKYNLGSDVVLSSTAPNEGEMLAILALQENGNKSLKILKEDYSQPENIGEVNLNQYLSPMFVDAIKKIRISDDEKRLLAVTGDKRFSVLELEPGTYKPLASREYHVGENTINKVWLHEDGKSVLIHAKKTNGSNFVSRVDIG